MDVSYVHCLCKANLKNPDKECRIYCIQFYFPPAYTFSLSITAIPQVPADCTFNVTLARRDQTLLVPPGVVCFTCDFGTGVKNNYLHFSFFPVPSYDGILVVPTQQFFPHEKQPVKVVCASNEWTKIVSAVVNVDGEHCSVAIN